MTSWKHVSLALLLGVTAYIIPNLPVILTDPSADLILIGLILQIEPIQPFEKPTEHSYENPH